MIKPDELRHVLSRAGNALYGQLWQSDMARAIGVSDRTVRRWVAGKSAVPASAWSAIVALMQRRAEALTDLAREITP